MKLLHSPFKYKIICSYCKSEISFKDEDIKIHSYCIEKEVDFKLTEEIKKAIINNSKDEYISNYLTQTNIINLVYHIILPKINCPYCGYENHVKTTNGKGNAIIDKYFLLDLNYKNITRINEFSETASYIMYNKHLIPEDLEL